MKRNDKNSFCISRGETVFHCETMLEAQCDQWVKKLQNMQSNAQNFPDDFLRPEEIPIDVVSKACVLECAVVEDDFFKGGNLREIVQFVALHSTKLFSGLVAV